MTGLRAFSTSVPEPLLGGSTGRVEASYIGALTLPPSVDGTLLSCLLVPFDRWDTEDTTEKVDDTDSFDPRLWTCSDGRLGGKAGDGCVESLRGGNRGGGAGFGASLWPVLVMVGGGSTPFCFGPIGSLPTLLPNFGDAVGRLAVFLL